MQKQPKSMLNEQEAAEFLGLSVAALRTRRYWRKPPTFVKLGRAVRYRLFDLERYVSDSRVTPREG